MKAFLPILVVTMVVVIAPVLAMRPSPRQSQLARLRARAMAQGLRVHLDAAGTRGGHADYVLPWRLDENPRLRSLHIRLERDAELGWRRSATDDSPPGLEKCLPGDLPESVLALHSTRDGLAIRWKERGNEAGVERIAEALRALREVLGMTG